EELKSPDLELNVLVSMENVTSRVQGAVKPGMTEKQALDARKAEQAKIQKESLDKTGLRSDVVSLYQGGEYWLYRYKKYTDVRIDRYKRELQALRAYSSRGAEQARQAADDIFSLENTVKAFTGEYNGMDKALFDKKSKEEADLRAKLAANPEWSREYGKAWDD